MKKKGYWELEDIFNLVAFYRNQEWAREQGEEESTHHLPPYSAKSDDSRRAGTLCRQGSEHISDIVQVFSKSGHLSWSSMLMKKRCEGCNDVTETIGFAVSGPKRGTERPVRLCGVCLECLLESLEARWVREGVGALRVPATPSAVECEG